jgi:hypothetical protein
MKVLNTSRDSTVCVASRLWAEHLINPASTNGKSKNHSLLQGVQTSYSLYSVLRQVRSSFQGELSRERELVFPLPDSIIFSFP